MFLFWFFSLPIRLFFRVNWWKIKLFGNQICIFLFLLYKIRNKPLSTPRKVAGNLDFGKCLYRGFRVAVGTDKIDIFFNELSEVDVFMVDWYLRFENWVDITNILYHF